MTLQDEINIFLTQEDKTRELLRYPISTIKDALEEEGYIMEDLDDNTNGWDVDFWYYFNKEGSPRVTLMGSLWYGDYKLVKE